MAGARRPLMLLPETFARNSGAHWATVVVCLAAVAGLAWAGRRARAGEARREWRLRVRWVWFVVVFQATVQVWQNLPGRIELRQSLPLHVCDLAPWLGVLALLTRNPWARALAWFWGVGLSIWAFVLPALDAGPARLVFWAFWIGHTQIIATAAYLVWVLDHRPSLTDLRRAAVALAAYTLLVLPLDLWLDADYGYVGRDSLASPLGPWPWRVAVLFAAELGIFAVALLPWALARRLGRSGSPGRE